MLTALDFPISGTQVIHAQNYGMSLWGKTAKIVVDVPGKGETNYFLKVVNLGATGRHMCEGEFESLTAIHSVSPGFVPEPYAWGKYTREGPDIYFLLTEFRDVGKQVSFLNSCSVWPTANPHLYPSLMSQYNNALKAPEIVWSAGPSPA